MIAFEKLLLRQEDVEFLTASTGRQAIEAAKRDVPDLILLDIVMSEMDGLECCRRLRASPLTSEVPIIMVTTKGNQEMVQAAFMAGCTDFVTKPLDKVELIRKIRKHSRPDVAMEGQAFR